MSDLIHIHAQSPIPTHATTVHPAAEADSSEPPELEFEVTTADGNTYGVRIRDKQIALWFIAAVLAGWFGWLALAAHPQLPPQRPQVPGGLPRIEETQTGAEQF